MVECRRMYNKNGGAYTFCVPGPKGSITSGQQSLSNQRKSKSQAKKPSGRPPKKPSGAPPKKPRGPPKNKAGVKLPKGPAPKRATKPAVNKVSRKLINNRGRPTKPAPRTQVISATGRNPVSMTRTDEGQARADARVRVDEAARSALRIGSIAENMRNRAARQFPMSME